jgi:excisionase family DNA binding protein
MVMGMLTATPQTTGPRDHPGGRVALTRDQVMTAPEVAELLHLPVSTVYYLARHGELPASRFGRTWRFLRPRIERLLEE